MASDRDARTPGHPEPPNPFQAACGGRDFALDNAGSPGRRKTAGASGRDYTAASGTFSFAAGETSKTVSISVLDDDHDKASGVYLLYAEGAGTLAKGDPKPKALMRRLRRAAAHDAIEHAEERLTVLHGTRLVVEALTQFEPAWSLRPLRYKAPLSRYSSLTSRFRLARCFEACFCPKRRDYT